MSCMVEMGACQLGSVLVAYKGCMRIAFSFFLLCKGCSKAFSFPFVVLYGWRLFSYFHEQLCDLIVYLLSNQWASKKNITIAMISMESVGFLLFELSIKM